MRWLVFLLVLGNLLFFAYAEGYFGKPHNPDAVRVHKQIRPENIRVVSRDIPPPGLSPVKPNAGDVAVTATSPAEPPPESATAKPATETAQAKSEDICLAWSGLAVKEADQLADLLKDKFNDFKQARRTEKTAVKSWWVFIPPLPTKADADKKAGELKQLGIKDFIVVQDAAPNRLAISLGVFSTEATARTRLAELREKGVKSAKLEPYSNKDAVVLEARGPVARQQALLDTTKAVSSIKLEAKVCQ